MKENIFIDENGQELIVKHRKSAVFFEAKADVNKPNSYGQRHSEYICIKELCKNYSFSKKVFISFIKYCETIGNESWKHFKEKEVDNLSSEYDDYYDKEFDNNGRLIIKGLTLLIEGPYTQLKSDGEIIRLIKFNKRKFESFLFDLKSLDLV